MLQTGIGHLSEIEMQSLQFFQTAQVFQSGVSQTRVVVQIQQFQTDHSFEMLQPRVGDVRLLEPQNFEAVQVCELLQARIRDRGLSQPEVLKGCQPRHMLQSRVCDLPSSPW